MSGTDISRWADAAMYASEPMPDLKAGPRVTLLNATPDPLGSLAALAGMYEGRVIRSLAEVTDDDRRAAFDNMLSTELQGPLEVAQFHFLVEGVTRSFTHQMVRERQAFFAQESMRFAVPEGQAWVERVAYPPSLAGSKGDEAPGAESSPLEYQRNMWDAAVETAEQTYLHMVHSGMPAEDARGLMPHAMTTRLHWVLDLRGLLHVAGLRLCTQAQFEWRQVMAGVVKALREYGRTQYKEYYASAPDFKTHGPVSRGDGWQFQLIAEQLRPVCYQQGRCGFMAKFDRGCTIRERVEENARVGRPSSEWHEPKYGNDHSSGRCGDHDCEAPEEIEIEAINPAEWAADPTAARRKA